MRAAWTLLLDFQACRRHGLVRGEVELGTVLTAAAVHGADFDRRVHLLVFLGEGPVGPNLVAAFKFTQRAAQRRRRLD